MSRFLSILEELEARGMMPEKPPSLDPMRTALARLSGHMAADLSDPGHNIVVAGTNGKGSTCAALESLLIDAGQRVGLYTSPHLVSPTERFRIDGRDISEERFCAWYESVEPVVRDIPLTHFEMLTLMAVVGFLGEEKPDWRIFEVGLGGVWDATNAIPHTVCCITALGLDHQNLLGKSIGEIAGNKFGIVTPRALVVHAPFCAEAGLQAEVVRVRTESRWVEARPCSMEVEYEKGGVGVGVNDPRFVAVTPWGRADSALAGWRGVENAATALTLFSELGFEPGSYLTALEKIRWPGRMEKMHVSGVACPVYFSGDHNPQGVQSLIDLLPHYGPFSEKRRLRLVIGVGQDKDCDGVLAPLTALGAELYLTETPFRGRKLAGYGDWLKRAEFASADPWQAFEKAAERCAGNDLLLVTGSLYLVGRIQGLIKKGAKPAPCPSANFDSNGD